jgi:thioredoxin-dependent peroxiredoxin
MAPTPVLRADPAPRSATGEMARIADGEPARAFRTMDISGNVVDLTGYPDKHILLSFFRFASCPFCNLRVHRLIERYPAYHDAGLAVIAVFESPRETMLRYVAGRMDAPFPLIADPEDHLYRLYGLEKSWGKFAMAYINPRVAATCARDAAAAGFGKGFWPGKIDAAPHRMPADFLIGPDMTVRKAWYGTYPGDHLPFETIDRLLSNAPGTR